MYILNRRMRVGGQFREPGTSLPEAADWPWQVRESYLRNGHISQLPPEAEKRPRGRKEPANGEAAS